MAAKEYQTACWFRWAVLVATALLAMKAVSLCPSANLMGGILWP